ncbi:hypothetical protein [Ralstonia pseudosolanacearum]|uniref:hypothetical protein n=1 Tax=Ralstonia pseudosolanacearum TaxID=1310165 RepID=UPI0023D9818D|nr:hypothetical protein [Ralstonia pseudosolanacearum]
MKRLAKAIAVIATLTGASLAPASHAQSPEFRVGTAKVCPSKFNGSTNKGEALPGIVAALAANAAMQLTSSLIDDITTYLDKKPATTLVDVYPVDALLGFDGKDIRFADGTQCVWVAAATSFVAPTINPLGAPSGKREFSDAELTQWVPFYAKDKKVFLQMTGLNAVPVFYFEAEVVTAPTNDAWRLVPNMMWYPSFISKSNVFQSQTHDVAFTIQYSEPGKDDQPFATFSVMESDVEEGTLPGKVVGKRLGWMNTVTAQPPTNVRANAGPYFPVDIKAQLVETRKPNQLADALSKALGAKKTDIATAVSGKVTYALSSQARADAATQATNDLKTANDAYNTAYTAAKDAMDKYLAAVNSGDSTATTLALNNARVAALVLQLATGAAQNAAAAAGSHFDPAPDPTASLPKA